ncbi:WD40 repeat-like protein [Karstenula rhodostoma CBS 690.94]|uniref:WD40 repeat-like protein n=1 Tax=Karstenula rhodostoma CBS 690.94 TaxID=1392251 RepID=A0A9P4P792_9PLEO|nr:WD40 repeat-like protein [Karstenula rhodostoma CBS 690.94]
MKYSVYDRLLEREVATGRNKRYSSVLGLYGDRQWAQDMDIVNELEGHNGCVNALCWSTSGRLLASGSDDHRINIHSYQPESSTSQFSLTTSILTGHQSNIFSVKFMPYSNDRTIVSATDDVRIFDIEHSGHSAFGSAASGRSQGARRRVGIQGAPDGLTLTEGDTNAKAFRSHKDTVKRIVTEDTPFYFLTCSEDGDVRQWDVRQPSRVYPPQRDSMMPSWAAGSDASDSVPPPLISYSRYHLDLNTVSCSPSQPHYIALGGAHLHCFLHDRRMLGRDMFRERGAKFASVGTQHDDEMLGKATQCVKKFAPNGQQKMKRRDNGHITSCKISDANPNELIVSWSGDYIYSFDMMRSPDASEETEEAGPSKAPSKRRVKDKSRKRKRTKSSILSLDGADRAGSRQRTESSEEGLALRVNYANGQSEEIRVEAPNSPLTTSEAAAVQDTDHYRIAKTTIGILPKMFDLSEVHGAEAGNPAAYKAVFTSVLGFAASVLPDMDEISRTWGYPVDPSPVDVAVQNKLREQRGSFRRFVQAAGTLARVLGGQLRTGGDANVVIAQYFAFIQHIPGERRVPRHEQFAYDFLKAILLWLDSGVQSVIDGFASPSSNPRMPLPPDADSDAIDEILIPYLLQLASDDPIVNVDVSRFETDETRLLYSSEKAAVIAFSRAVKIPFADLTGALAPASGDVAIEDDLQGQDRTAAVKNWAFKIGRGLLLNAAKGICFSAVDRAFGGSGLAHPSIQTEENEHRERQEDIDPLEEDDVVVDAELMSRAWADETITDSALVGTSNAQGIGSSENSGLPIQEPEEITEEEYEDEEGDDDSDGDVETDVEEEEDEDDVDENGLARTRSGRVLWRSDFDRSYLRERVESHVPCSPHTRVYTGHCNVRTVKDVNFFGQDDEYVVSGSDCGHVFIWDRKTAQLVNILEGDGEVVNVVQGNPYEPTMAVSGIDHTIKIFSPDANAQRNARKGVGVHSADRGLSSLGFGRRRRPRRPSATSPPAVPRDPSLSDDDVDDDEVAENGLKSRKAMHEQYQITSQNDMDRKGGREDAFITRALLAQLAQRLHGHQQIVLGGGGAGGGEEDEDGEATIVFNNEEGCNVQ